MKFPDYVKKPVFFDAVTGLAHSKPALERRYSDMKNMYLDENRRKEDERGSRGRVHQRD